MENQTEDRPPEQQKELKVALQSEGGTQASHTPERISPGMSPQPGGSNGYFYNIWINVQANLVATLLLAMPPVVLILVGMIAHLVSPWDANYDTVFMVIILSVVFLFILLVYNVVKIGWSLVHLFEPLDVRTILWAMLVCVMVLFLCLIGFAEDFQNRLTSSYVVGIAFDGDQSMNISAMKYNIENGGNIILRSVPQPASSDQNKETLLRNYIHSRHLSALIWVQNGNDAASGRSGPQIQIIDGTEPLSPLTASPAPAESIAPIDLARRVEMSILEITSLRQCQSRNYDLVLSMSRQGRAILDAGLDLSANGDPNRPWKALFLSSPQYLVCLLEATYASDKRSPELDELGAPLINTLDKMWKGMASNPDQQLIIGLLYAQLLVENGNLDTAETLLDEQRVLNGLDALSQNRAAKYRDRSNEYSATAQRLVGEIVLARSQVASGNQKLDLLNRAKGNFNASIQNEPSQPFAYFGLGRADFLLFLRETNDATSTAPDISASQMLSDSIQNLAMADSNLNGATCLRRNILTWLIAAYALSHQQEAQNGVNQRIASLPCPSVGIGGHVGVANLDTPLVVSDRFLTARVAIEKIASNSNYTISVLPLGLVRPVTLTEYPRESDIYSATLDLQEIFAQPFAPMYLPSQGKLEMQRNYQLAVFADNAKTPLQTFPLRLVVAPQLVVNWGADVAQVVTSGEIKSVDAWIQYSSGPSGHPVVLDQDTLLDQLEFRILTVLPINVQPRTLIRIPETGKYSGAYTATTVGTTILQVVVRDKNQGETIVLASPPFTLTAAAPLPTPTPLPSPTPAPTPDMRPITVAVVLHTDEPIRASPALTSTAIFTLPEPCAIIEVFAPPSNAPTWVQGTYHYNQASVSGYVPISALGVIRTVTRDTATRLEVSIDGTSVYTDPVATTPFASIPACTLLERRANASGQSSAEGRQYGAAYLTSDLEPLIGWFNASAIIARPLQP